MLAVALGVMAAISPITLGVSQRMTRCMCCHNADLQLAAVLHDTTADDCCRHSPSDQSGTDTADPVASSGHTGCSDCSGCLLLSSTGVSGLLLPGTSAIVEQPCGYISVDETHRLACGFLTSPQRPPALA